MSFRSGRTHPRPLLRKQCTCRHHVSKRACRNVELHTTPSRCPAVKIAICTWPALLIELIPVSSGLPGFVPSVNASSHEVVRKRSQNARVRILYTPETQPTKCYWQIWHVRHSVIDGLLDHVDSCLAIGNEFQHGREPFVFEEANDDFHLRFSSFPSIDTGSTDHRILDFILKNSLSNPKVKHVVAPSEPLNSHPQPSSVP